MITGGIWAEMKSMRKIAKDRGPKEVSGCRWMGVGAEIALK